eukprot:CAMPEP_0177766818 /NCGR_PEP_ID=MMETSP0491_2-20121128/8726_1 /TAXON_ID=63592 /ORGANISM="Tetraselmis chuii, Strain PLY429" /LENGTH=56 /DNA_ID=CAMNT_0019283255 /DNA_START=276 /DNA_END=446 /DNA_ORIENTATION=+
MPCSATGGIDLKVGGDSSTDSRVMACNLSDETPRRKARRYTRHRDEGTQRDTVPRP